MTRTRCRTGENRARHATSFARAHGRTGAYSVPTATVGVEYVTSGEVISSPRWNLTASLSHDWRVGDGGKVTAVFTIRAGNCSIPSSFQTPTLPPKQSLISRSPIAR